MVRVGVTGHQNLPVEAVPFISQGIAHLLDNIGNEFVGVSSLAAGADQLFAEAVLQRNNQLHAVIPCQGYELTFTNDATLHLYTRLLDSATFVEVLTYPRPGEEAFLAAGYRVVSLSDILVAVWDGLEAQGVGGTADIVRRAYECKKEVFVIWPPGITR